MSRGRGPSIAPLAEIAAILRDRELGKVEQITAHINRLQADANTLRAAREDRQADPSIDAARLTGVDVAWQAWSDEHLRRTQAQLAALRVSHEAALAEARLAYGRCDALSKLAKRKS